MQLGLIIKPAQGDLVTGYRDSKLSLRKKTHPYCPTTDRVKANSQQAATVTVYRLQATAQLPGNWSKDADIARVFPLLTALYSIGGVRTMDYIL